MDEVLIEPERTELKEQRLFKKILYGKKVILFDFVPSDLQHFVKLHRDDKNGYMQNYCLKKMTEEEAMKFTVALFMTGQIKCWSVYLKQNSLKNLLENRRAGFIYLNNFTSFSANIAGIMDIAVTKGLLKQIRHDKVTFAEDSIRTLVNHCFNDMGLKRIETTVLSNNRKALALDKKCGFVEEGRLRKAFQMDDGFMDVIQLSILESDKEWKNEQR